MEIDRPIVIGITAFAVLLMLFFLVVPQYKQLQKLQVELAQKTAEFNSQYDYYAEITKNYFIIQSKKEDIQKIDDALPKGANLGELMYYLQKKVKDNGLILKTIFLSQSTADTSSGVKDLTFSLSFNGDYTSLNQFIESLENSARIFDISNLNFGSVVVTSKALNQFQSDGIFDFSVELKTHTY